MGQISKRRTKMFNPGEMDQEVELLEDEEDAEMDVAPEPEQPMGE